jgi:hypothetical protein
MRDCNSLSSILNKEVEDLFARRILSRKLVSPPPAIPNSDGEPMCIDAPLRCAQTFGVRNNSFLSFYGTAEAVP